VIYIKKSLSGFARRVLKFRRSAPLARRWTPKAVTRSKIGVTETTDAAKRFVLESGESRQPGTRDGSCYCWAPFACDAEGISNPAGALNSVWLKGQRGLFPILSHFEGA